MYYFEGMVKSLMTRMEKAVAGTDGDDDERNGRLCGVGIESVCVCGDVCVMYITARLYYNHHNQHTHTPIRTSTLLSPSLPLSLL